MLNVSRTNIDDEGISEFCLGIVRCFFNIDDLDDLIGTYYIVIWCYATDTGLTVHTNLLQ